MNQKIRNIGYVLLSAGITICFYIFLHELGHAMVMLSAGATITGFSIFTAHVSADGGNFTNLSDMWMNANGALLPLMISYLYILFYRKSSTGSFYRIFSYMVAIIAPCSTLAWVIIPFVYQQGNAPVNDDVTKFLTVFCENYHPFLVSAVAAILMGIGILLMIKKRVIHNFMEEIRQK